MLCTVVTDSKSPGIGSGLTYETDLPVRLGSHVTVPLRNTVVEGVVVALSERRQKEQYDIKKVKEILGNAPLLNEAQIQTASWIAEYYYCSLRQALGLFLPSPPWKKFLPTAVISYALIPGEQKIRGRKQQDVLDYLRGKDGATKEEIMEATGATSDTLRRLVEKNVLEMVSKTEEESPTPRLPLHIPPPSLTSEQQIAYESIAKDARPSLLFGITGSGKTEIYAELIADCINRGNQAILLVPEILLTEHSMERFTKLLDPTMIAVVHSRLTGAQRRSVWQDIRSGKTRLVIGSRSALFAPARKLKLMILDEEHEWTYKNEQTPRYHAREAAQKLCKLSGAKLVLGSATPSLESWSRVQDKEYHRSCLPNRYNNQTLPSVQIIDLANVNFGDAYPFSPLLIERIEETLNHAQQSVLFMNRRGIATALLCLACRRRVISPDSQLPFTVHHAHDGKPYLYDHTMGTKCAVPSACPACGSANLRAIGAGTQKLEQILEKRFPSARVLRADSDTLTHPEHMRLLLKKMREGQADILVGTQSVVKGLDLPNVTFAAVLLADIGLSLPHFRAGERTFQLLSQLAGRSGRSKPGTVIIQTFRPDAPEIKLAANHETENYLEQELKLRRHMGYPPVTNMVRLILRKENAAKRAMSLLTEIRSVDVDMKAGAAPTLFGGGREWHVLIWGEDPKRILKHLDLSDVVVDIDPVECV